MLAASFSRRNRSTLLALLWHVSSIGKVGRKAVYLLLPSLRLIIASYTWKAMYQQQSCLLALGSICERELWKNQGSCSCEMPKGQQETAPLQICCFLHAESDAEERKECVRKGNARLVPPFSSWSQTPGTMFSKIMLVKNTFGHSNLPAP